MNKRGAYFFVIDALIAASIVFLSLIIIFTTHNIKPESNPTLRLVEEYTSYLMKTRIRDFQGTYITNLTQDGNITNLDSTLLEQLTEFYYLNESGIRDTTTIMSNYIASISRGSIIPAQRSFEIYMNNTLLYSRANTPMQGSNLVLNSKKITYKRINETYIYGPLIFEVTIWV